MTLQEAITLLQSGKGITNKKWGAADGLHVRVHDGELLVFAGNGGRVPWVLTAHDLSDDGWIEFGPFYPRSDVKPEA